MLRLDAEWKRSVGTDLVTTCLEVVEWKRSVGTDLVSCRCRSMGTNDGAWWVLKCALVFYLLRMSVWELFLFALLPSIRLV